MQNDPAEVPHLSKVAPQKQGLFVAPTSRYTIPIASQLVLHLPCN